MTDHSAFAYIEADIPPQLTIADYRRSRRPAPARRRLGWGLAAAVGARLLRL
jgi:hypothetical protein